MPRKAQKASKIDETLRKLASATLSGTRSDAVPPETTPASHNLAGDPNCPYCHGLGYLRRDLPVSHPEFGKLQICSCRQEQVAQRIHQRLFAISNLERLSHLTFENFRPEGQMGLNQWQAASVTSAFNQAQQFAQHLNGWLLLQGGYGSGKTHLAAAIANFAVGMGVPTLFITVPDLLDSLRFAYDDPESTFEQRFEEIRSSPLLIMDDFGTQNATGWAQEKLFQVINYRYINRLPLVVTTNLLLEELEERIRSRLEDPGLVTVVNIRVPDYRRPLDDTGRSDLSTLALHRSQTFSTFRDRSQENLRSEDQKSLEAALKAATSFAQDPQGWLVITGPYGCGKTHLAAAIANACSDRYEPLFIVVPDLLDHLRATFHPRSTVSLDRRFEEIRKAWLLILDDLGSQSTTQWSREKLYQIFNYRYDYRLPTVITTPSLKEDIDSRLLSRMEDTRLCRIVGITASSYRGQSVTSASPVRRKAPK
ncbi:MAG: ATP-binding protein [Anaerolineales bacterium]|nr:ATP-binding protein [Anaerolineales bacterium]